MPTNLTKISLNLPQISLHPKNRSKTCSKKHGATQESTNNRWKTKFFLDFEEKCLFKALFNIYHYYLTISFLFNLYSFFITLLRLCWCLTGVACPPSDMLIFCRRLCSELIHSFTLRYFNLWGWRLGFTNVF